MRDSYQCWHFDPLQPPIFDNFLNKEAQTFKYE